MRYYFNLTSGDEVIRDRDGIELSDIHSALLHAMKAVEELRAEDPSSSQEWKGWRLEIVDASGRLVHSLSLDQPTLN